MRPKTVSVTVKPLELEGLISYGEFMCISQYCPCLQAYMYMYIFFSRGCYMLALLITLSANVHQGYCSWICRLSMLVFVL